MKAVFKLFSKNHGGVGGGHLKPLANQGRMRYYFSSV